MPIRHYECANHHITEHIDYPKKSGKTTFSIKDIEELSKNRKTRTIQCDSCDLIAEEVFMSIADARNAKRFQPTLLYINPSGEVIVPGRNDPSHLPKEYRDKLSKEGYREITISNFREYESFTRQQRSRLNQQRDQYISQQQALYDQQLESQIAAFKRGDVIQMPLNSKGDYRTLQIRLDDLSPRMRELADHAIEQARNFRIKGDNPNPYIESMEFDNTSYRDQDTSWKRRR